MPSCVTITKEKIRSTVDLSGYEVKTPYVKGFSIDRSRGKPAKTFSAQLEIPAGANFVPGSDIIIYAGEKDNEKKRFTGMIKTITIQPSFDKAGYYILNISGADIMDNLKDKTFSRRLRSDGFSMFVSIDSGPANRPSRGMSIDKRVRGGKHTFTAKTPKPTSADHTKVTYMPKRNSGKHGVYNKAAGIGSGQEDGSGGGFKTHSHDSMDKGGPAWGTYSTD
jgi:hypothetical protein